jgi:hypothetical protein
MIPNVSSQTPSSKATTKTTGIATSSVLRICTAVIRPDGIGREALLIASSVPLSRWLARSKMRRLSQLNRTTRGERDIIESREGEDDVVRMGPERAPKVPKNVLGITKVRISLAVSDQRRASADVTFRRRPWISVGG